MRKLLVLAFLAAACGGSSDDGGGSMQLSGTLGGRAFTIADVKAIPASSGATPCDQVPVLGTAGIKAIALQVTSHANACDAYSGTGCTLHQNAQAATVIFARIAPGAVDVTPVPLATTGKDYTISAGLTSALPDGATGYLAAAYALALATDATCAAPAPAVQSGTIRFTSVGDPIAGRVSVTFANGDRLQGDFSAPLCAGSGLDVCSLVETQSLCPTAPACVP